ncbi:MAG: hypothetical protein QOD06_253, partial [Candidatus Binatota bacterium]|nr:hypothetical protein [Candidatus Binatota bacterium]
NDPADGISSGVDTNSTVTLTSFGSGPNAVGYSVVQAEVRTALTGLVLQLPGVITLPGPTVDFQPFSGNAHKIDGEDQSANGCFPTIAVSSSQALAQVKSAIAKRSSAYTSCDPGQGPHLSGGNAVENFVENTSLTRANAYEPDTFNLPPLGSGDPRLTSVPHLTELVRKIREIADYTSPTEAGFTLGSATDPKIVVIDGDFSMSDTGNGILVVTGKLTFDGAVNYRGLVLAIGEGSVVIDGGGGGSFKGAMLVANTVEPWDDEGKWVGIPHYADNGGGNALQAYDSNGARGFPARDFAPIEVVSYHPLR